MRKGPGHWYLPILTICVAVCVTEAAARSERSRMGAAGIEKRDSGISLTGFQMGAATGGIERLADRARDSWLRQPATHITTQDSADSFEAPRPAGRFVISFAYSRKTYVPAIGLSLRHIGVYFPEAYFPFTWMDTDTGSTGISCTWILPLTFALTGEWLAGKVLGARWLQLGIRYVLLFPVLALNSYHHLVVMSDGGAMEQPRKQLTAFLGSRWDLWEHARRWTPMVGLQYSVIGSEQGHPGLETGGALFAGIEAPVDLSSQGRAIPGVFIGLKIYIGGAD